jgi:hypothetical protein
MGHSKHQQSNMEVDKEQLSKKNAEQKGNEAEVNLSGIVQRVTNESTRRPEDILALQRIVGNRIVRRTLSNADSREGASRSSKRHSSPQAEAMYWQAKSEEIVAKDKTKASLQTAQEGAKSMLAGWNSLKGAYDTAKSVPAGGAEAGGGGGSQAPQTGGEAPTSPGEEDIYEGGEGGQTTHD